MDENLFIPELETLFTKKYSKTEIYKKILDNSSDGIGIFEIQEKINALYLNEQYYKIAGLNPTEFTPYISDITSRLFPEDNYLLRKKAMVCFKCKSTLEYVARKIDINQRVNWYYIRASCIDFIKSKYPVFLAYISDITRAKTLEHSLTLTKSRSKIFEETSNTILFDYDILRDTMNFSYNESGKIKKWSISNYKKSPSLIHPHDKEKFNRAIFSASFKVIKGELEYRTREIHPEKYIWCKLIYSSVANSSGAITNIFGRICNIEHEIINRNNMIKRAETDPLTGIYNRLAGEQKITERIIFNYGNQNYFAIVDIDDFKHFNDVYGHIFGDEVLKTVSRKLYEFFPNSIVCRFGGDEFIVFINESCHEKVLKKFQDFLKAANCNYNNIFVKISLSIGIAASREKISYNAFLENADKIMYDVKKSGKNNIVIRNIDDKEI